jgi:hypothetical protein
MEATHVDAEMVRNNRHEKPGSLEAAGFQFLPDA